MKQSAPKTLYLFALAFFLAPIAAHAQGATDRPTLFMYAAKFVCGKSDEKGIVAPGQYFTAINVHNPSIFKPAIYVKRFALALPEEQPGSISDLVRGVLKPDQAMGIDCPNIYKHTGNKPGQFIEGYALLYSLSELDVVSIYTAGHGEVETLHTERVPARKFVIGRQSALTRRLMEE